MCLILLFNQFLFFSLQILLVSVLFDSYISLVALVLVCKYFFLASFFCVIIKLLSSSHHSFRLYVFCVCITSFTDSNIVCLIYIHSSSMLCCISFLFNLMWRHFLYCFSLIGPCKLFWFHLVCLIGAICVLIIFCFIMVLTRKWSESQFRPRVDLASSTTLFYLASIITWSIWFRVLPSGVSHVPLWIFLCW